MLKAVAERLVAVTRPEDYVSRFGGDEFLVLCRELLDDESVAVRIRDELSRPYEVLGRQISVGASIGIATLGEDTDRAETLINNADVALYRTKNNGRGLIGRYSDRPTLPVTVIAKVAAILDAFTADDRGSSSGARACPRRRCTG